MNTMRVLYHVALADFFERARQYRFLLTLAAILALGILVNNGTVFFDLKQLNPELFTLSYRGEFNSAWIGTMITMMISIVFGLFSFFLVSDCIGRDIRTGVGQIIATTPIRRATYLVGKWISNFVVLFVLILILAIAAVAMVLLKHEAVLDFGAILMPFLAVALPYMAFIAALAVVFETVPWLRGAVGNVVYFFLWLSITILSFSWPDKLPVLKDPLGINVFRTSLFTAAKAAFPNDMIGGMGVSFNYSGIQFKIFNWTGLDWTPQIIAEQWLWAAIGLGLVLLSAAWFARFDPSREGLRQARAKPDEAYESKPAEPQKNALHAAQLFLFTFISRLDKRSNVSLLISKVAQVNPFLGVLFAELRMLFNGRRWWWWIITLGLNIAILSSPYPITKEYLFPIACLWLLPVLSGLGNREHKNNTYQMVFSSSRPVLRQLPAAWLAGVLTTASLLAAGAIVSIIKADYPALAGWVGAVIFIPTLALALGVISSGSRVFEVIYVIWWYLGPMQKTPGMDFINGSPHIYLLAAAGLLLLSVYWRSRQVRA